MIIGFGSTEKEYEKKLEEKFISYVKSLYNPSDDNIFTDEFINEIQKWSNLESISSREEADRYKNSSDYPDRYSSYYCYVLGDCNYIVFIIDFSHINRRHAFSPDGWAMLQNKRAFAISVQECY